MRKEPNRNVYVGHRYVPLILEEWNKNISYEGLSVVTHKGNSYTSKKRVPVGIDILNKEFWSMTGNYNAQIEYYRDETEKVSNDLLLKSDKTYVDSELGKKSDKTYVDTELGKKANKTYVDSELGKKTDKTYVDTELGKKSDKTYVDTELNKKSDLTFIDTIVKMVPINNANVSKSINDYYQTLNDGDTIKMKPGEYDLYEPLVFDKDINIDFKGVSFNYYGEGTAITVGTDEMSHESNEYVLPNIKKGRGIDWFEDIHGVRTLNIYNCFVYFGNVSGFKRGIIIDSNSNIGNCYNEYHFRRVVNNLESLVLTSSGKGWTNENTFHSGRFGITSDMSERVTALNTHVLIEYNDYSQNNNIFYSVSFESGSTTDVEHVAIIEDGRMIYFRDCRYEGVHKVKILKGTDIQFTNGFGAYQLEFTDRQPQSITSQIKSVESKNEGFTFNSSASASNDIMTFKSGGSDTPRAIIKGDGTIETNSGIKFRNRIEWGNELKRGLYIGNSSPIDNFVADAGALYSDYRNGDLYTKTFGANDDRGWKKLQVINSGSSGGRPATPVTGFQYFDLSIGKPIWFNGTEWVDSTGTVV